MNIWSQIEHLDYIDHLNPILIFVQIESLDQVEFSDQIEVFVYQIVDLDHGDLLGQFEYLYQIEFLDQVEVLDHIVFTWMIFNFCIKSLWIKLKSFISCDLSEDFLEEKLF